MKSIARLFSAFSTLADSVLALASVIDNTTAKLSRQLDYEPEPARPEVLDHQPEVVGNGQSRRKK